MTQSVRYDFGRNWREFSRGVTEEAIQHAESEFLRLVGSPTGKTFLDIGSGSGLHSLCALRLGAKSVTAFDYDSDSVDATRSMLSARVPNGNWTVFKDDILDPSHAHSAGYDIVYSWGVLHHTGDVWRALANAASLVRDGGQFAVALYLKTPFCGIWKREKRLFVRSPLFRKIARPAFAGLLLLAYTVKGRNPVRVVLDYERQRGMAFSHDVDDWLGGYPYESVTDRELVRFMAEQNLELIGSFNVKPAIGVFGAGCGEWLFCKRGPKYEP